MKKFLIILVVVVLVMAFATSAFAAGHGHPNIDPNKAGRANENAMEGLHNAHHNVMHNSNGRADHILHNWVIDCPSCPHD